MLQVIITPSHRYTVGQAARMAVGAGAQWLQLRLPDMDDAGLREAVSDIVELCREAGVMLTIEDRTDIAREMSLHGVFLHAGANPVKVREEFGAEAVIGTVVGSADAAIAMSRADIDYVALEEHTSPALIVEVRRVGCRIPVVAYRPGSLLDGAEVESLMSQDFSGICGADGVFDTDNPGERIAAILEQLGRR